MQQRYSIAIKRTQSLSYVSPAASGSALPEDSAVGDPGYDADSDDKPALKMETGTIIGQDGSTRISSDLEIQPGGHNAGGGAGVPGPPGPQGEPHNNTKCGNLGQVYSPHAL